MNKRRIVGMITIFILLGLGAIAGYIYAKHTQPVEPGDVIGNTYSLLAKRSQINNPNDALINFTSLRASLNEYFTNNNINGGLYFEYLPTGTSIRVADTDDQQTASLMKLPMAMEVFKAAENNKIQLDAPVALKSIWLDSSHGTLYQKGAGYTLSLRAAMEQLLAESDATALNMAAESLEGKIEPGDSVFYSVDISFSRSDDSKVAISPRSYSSLLKCLYFSCYLEPQDSQELLGYLTKSNSTTRIGAGIPDKNVKVAHKIGILGDVSQSDCGIVYLPNRNYILCIMIQLPDDHQVDNHMADISSKIYSFVKSQ